MLIFVDHPLCHLWIKMICALQKVTRLRVVLAIFVICLASDSDTSRARSQEITSGGAEPIRVFIFAGQSNMVGSDSRVQDIVMFPPFLGIERPRSDVRFWYCIGRENKLRSGGWTSLQPVNQVVGPELTFARDVSSRVEAPIAIIKVAAGGTHLGGDWNPIQPTGFEMYPLMLEEVNNALVELDKQDLPWKLEGFIWHQGENDMFNQEYMDAYGENLTQFFECVRRDLKVNDLPFYIGELCTKTIWGMDLRPRMHAISVGQKAAVKSDAHATYIPTSHIGVEVGGGVGLHYHYGTLGQLQHGVNYADAYLASIDQQIDKRRELSDWPYDQDEAVQLIVMAGHRNMEGERAFVQELEGSPTNHYLQEDNPAIAYRYSLGGGAFQSDQWEPLGVVGRYQTFGPELSFAKTVQLQSNQAIAIAKFTHSGSQMIDWTPEGSIAVTRNLYPKWIDFIRSSIADLKARGHSVNLTAVIYHVGENDMSYAPFRRAAPEHLRALIQSTRSDLKMPDLQWIVSQQSPTSNENLDKIPVMEEVAKIAKTDRYLMLVNSLDLPPQPKQLVLNTGGIIALGEQLAKTYLQLLNP